MAAKVAVAVGAAAKFAWNNPKTAISIIAALAGAAYGDVSFLSQEIPASFFLPVAMGAAKVAIPTLYGLLNKRYLNKDKTQWLKHCADLPDMQPYTSDEHHSPIDGVYQDYLEWTKTVLQAWGRTDKTPTKAYLTLLAYVFTSNAIREREGEEFGKLGIRLGFVSQNSVFVWDGPCNKLKSLAINEHSESFAWAATLSTLQYFKFVPENQRDETMREGTIQDNGDVKIDGGGVLDKNDEIKRADLHIDPRYTLQSHQTLYMPKLVGQPANAFTPLDLSMPSSFDNYNWILSVYFGDKKLYMKFLPSYSTCKEFVEKVVNDLNPEVKTTCINNLKRLVSNTVASLTTDEQRVWDLQKSFYQVYSKEAIDSLSEATKAKIVSTQTHRVIVNNEKIIAANTVRCGKALSKIGQDDKLLLGQTILLRVLYLIRVLLLDVKSEDPPRLDFDKSALAKIAHHESSSNLDDTMYDTSDLEKYTAWTLNYPRTTLTADMFAPSVALPTITKYKSHLIDYIPKLLAVKSLNDLNKVVDNMLSRGSEGVGALITNEIATNITKKDKETVNQIDEKLNTLCASLYSQATTTHTTHTSVESTNVARFAEIAVKYERKTTTDTVDKQTFALRVVYTCCQAFGMLGDATESTFGEVVVIKAPRYTVEEIEELPAFTNQRTHDVRMRDNEYMRFDEAERSQKITQELGGQVGRRIASKKHYSDHKNFKTAVNTIYTGEMAKPEPFSTFGYVVYFVRWLASVVATIGQFSDKEGGRYVKLLIKEDSIVLFEFSNEEVPNITTVVVQASQTSCFDFCAMFHTKPEQDTSKVDLVQLNEDQLPFVLAYKHNHATSPHYYYACQKNIPLQMTPSFVGTAENQKHEVWLDKIGFADIVLYRLSSKGDGLGLCVYTDNMAELIKHQLGATIKENVELLACYKMMDIPSFSCQFEALPLFDKYFSMLNAQGMGVAKQLFQPSFDKNILVFLEQVMLWALTGNFALPKVDQGQAYLQNTIKARKNEPLRGGNLDITKDYTSIPHMIYECHNVRALQKDTKGTKQDNPFLLGNQPLITNLMGFMLVTVNIEPHVAIHVLDMFWEYDKRNDGDVKTFHDKWKNIKANQTTNIEVDVVPTLTKLGLVVAAIPTTKRVKQQAQARQNKAPQESEAQKQARQQEESNWLQERNVPSTVKHKRTWELIQEYGFELLYRELSNIIDQRQDLVNALLGHIRDAALRKFAYNKNNKTAYDQAFLNYPRSFYPIGDRWYSTSSREAQEHAAKKGGFQQAQHFNNQGLNQGGVGAISGVGLAGLGAAAMYGQSAFNDGRRNMLNGNHANQQQPKGQVTFANHTTTGQTVHATVNTASELQDDADKRIQRVYADKLSNRARNLTFTDAQGRSVFTLLPHNILAIVLLLVYAILVLYASSIGTSTYTLLNGVSTQSSSYAANLPDLQKPRMACSTFFGIGVGMIVAFVVSLVEIVNNTRLRQALFIVLMAAPIIVLGAMGVSGASDVCGANSMTSNSSSGDLDASQQNVAVGSKRKRGTLEQKMPRVAKFFKSVLGTHDSDLDGSAVLGDAPSCTPGSATPVCSSDMKTTCNQTTACASGVCLTGTCNNDPSAPCATALDCVDDVTRNNMKASDFFFIGIGIGVLLAGFCTLIPGNPFHPDVHDTMHGLIKQKDFSVSSQIKRHWLIYFGLFSLVLLGGAASSLWLGSATPLAQTKDAKKGETIQGPANAQAGVMIGISFVLFFAIMVGGILHRRSHAKLALEVQSSGILHGQATASNLVLNQGQAQARK